MNHNLRGGLILDNKTIANNIVHDSIMVNLEKMIQRSGLEYTFDAIQRVNNPVLRAKFKQVYMEITNR